MSEHRITGEPFHCTLQVRWGDFDQLGHLNNVSYLELAQEARIKFFAARLGGTDFAHFATVVRHTEIDHMRPILPGSTTAEVTLAVEDFGRTSFTVMHELRDHSGDLCCEIRMVLVFVDTATHQPTPISTEAKRALAAARVKAALEPAADPAEEAPTA